MSDTPDNLILAMLRRIDGKLDRLVDDAQTVKHRMTSLEAKVALVHGDFANQSLRMDRIEARLAWIERRLHIVEA